jgi:hypothetical protein
MVQCAQVVQNYLAFLATSIIGIVGFKKHCYYQWIYVKIFLKEDVRMVNVFLYVKVVKFAVRFWKL